MESIFFRRLEPRRSTNTLVPLNGLTSVGGIGNFNPQYTTQYQPQQTYGNFLGSYPETGRTGLQSVVGTLGNIFSRGSSQYNIGQYNIGTYTGTYWGRDNLGVGNIMGNYPEMDRTGLQSVVGTLRNIFSGGRFGTPSTYSPAFDLSGIGTCYDHGYTPGCPFFNVIGGCRYIDISCYAISGPCSYIGGGCFDFGCQFGYTPPGCLFIGGGCNNIESCYDYGYIPGCSEFNLGCPYIGGGCPYIGGGCYYIDSCRYIIYY